MHHRLRRVGVAQSHVVILIALAGGVLVLASTWALRRTRGGTDIAKEAKDYLHARIVAPLDADWKRALTEPSIATLPHPLLGQPAPEFQLKDSTGRQHTLAEHTARGPVVLVFYYGYYCNHCVAQLFALHADADKFKDLGAQLISVSPDSPQETREKFAKYGEFAFPVLADPHNRIAAAYSLFQPAAKEKLERLLHGTFVIDRDGIVRWCHYDHAPFTANATLLVEVAKIQGSLPEVPSTSPPPVSAESQADVPGTGN